MHKLSLQSPRNEPQPNEEIERRRYANARTESVSRTCSARSHTRRTCAGRVPRLQGCRIGFRPFTLQTLPLADLCRSESFVRAPCGLRMERTQLSSIVADGVAVLS